jgi:WD40 repeat protein
MCADGRRAVTASGAMLTASRSMVQVWDLDTGMCLMTLKGHRVALHPDGRRAVTGCFDGNLRVWNLDTGVCMRTLKGHTSWVYSVALYADGRRAVSSSEDKTLRVWDLDTGECLRTLEGHATSVVVYADGYCVVSEMLEMTLRVWDLDTGQLLGTWFGEGDFPNLILGGHSTSSGARLIAGCKDGSVQFFELMPPAPAMRTTLAASYSGTSFPFVMWN